MLVKRSIALAFAAAFLAVASFSQTLPAGVQKVTSVEGLTEYSYPNGLRVVLFPDNSKPKVTVNVVYLVGSRNEGYGETGMAHLLEHMVFKTTKGGVEIFKALTDKTGGNFNGGTSYDQTMYYETLNAGDDNLRWALDLEANRMVNMTMKKEDLDTEMTVVRNELEASENSPLGVLQKRVMAAAFNFHNYGKTVIGNRTDVERVPIANLAAFYQKYYQPDNAVLVVAGQIDESKTLAMIAQTFGAIPKPQRTLVQPWAVEPVQEGEREVTLRRIGDVQGVMVVYHIPSALHPDAAALDVLSGILGGGVTGRVYKALVDTKKAVGASFSDNTMHDPGVIFTYAQLKPDQSITDARETLLKTVEGWASQPFTQEEVDRAKTRIAKSLELAMTNSQNMAMNLGGAAGSGDWRLMFLNRDEIAKVTLADVTRVAKQYLKPTNRTLGTFIPTKDLERSEIPATPEVSARFKDYKGGEVISAGEAFDPTPKNIEARVIRKTLPNGLKLVMFPKKTRGGTVAAILSGRFGDEKSLFGQAPAANMAGSLLMRGTKNKNRQQIQDEMDRLKAQVSASGGVSGFSGSVRTLEAKLADSLRLMRELLREPSFPEMDFEQLKQQRIASAESSRSEPGTLASLEISRWMNARYPRGDVRYTSTLDESMEDYRKVTLEEARQFYAKFYGVGEGEMVVSGQFDPAQVEKLVTELFGDWKSPARYARIERSYAKLTAFNKKIETPDKANAYFMAELPVQVSDTAPDYPALIIAGAVFGGSPNSRVFQRIRVKEGLSYSASGGFGIPTKDDNGDFSGYAIAAPQNAPKVEAAFLEEVAKVLKDGFTGDEVEKAKKTWLDERSVARAEETSIASLLMSRERWGRNLVDWDQKLEASVAALTPEQVNAAFKKYVNASGITIVKAGDFKKAGVLQ